jgi:dihydrofolate reductase
MSKQKDVRIELTEEQKKALREQTGQDASVIEFSVEELEQRIAPRYRIPGRSRTCAGARRPGRAADAESTQGRGSGRGKYDTTPFSPEAHMSQDKKEVVRIELTDEQKKAVREQTGQDANGKEVGMAKLVFGMNQSLDGYVDHMAFAPSPTLFRHFIEEAQGQAGSVYGRQMYEIMRYWDDDHPEWDAEEHAFAAAWRNQPKWVVSRSLKSVGPNARLVEDDLEGAIRELKAERDGEIEVAGPDLAQSLTELGLIDEYRIYLHPVVLGHGKPYFAGPRPPLRLMAHDRIGEDVIRLTYVPAGRRTFASSRTRWHRFGATRHTRPGCHHVWRGAGLRRAQHTCQGGSRVPPRIRKHRSIGR